MSRPGETTGFTKSNMTATGPSWPSTASPPGLLLALSQESAGAAIQLDKGILSGGDGRVLPLLRSFGSEDPHGLSGDQMALKIERVVDGGMNREKTLRRHR